MYRNLLIGDYINGQQTYLTVLTHVIKLLYWYQGTIKLCHRHIYTFHIFTHVAHTLTQIHTRTSTHNPLFSLCAGQNTEGNNLYHRGEDSTIELYFVPASDLDLILPSQLLQLHWSCQRAERKFQEQEITVHPVNSLGQLACFGCLQLYFPVSDWASWDPVFLCSECLYGDLNVH